MKQKAGQIIYNNMFRKIKKMSLKKNFDLKKVCTFHIGGKARYYIKCYKIVALKKVLKICQKHNLPYKIIGGGSNLLFDDQGFDGAIIKFCDNSCSVKAQTLVASSGIAMADLIAVAKNHSLSGLENFVGIPCTLGGAIYNNLGANNIEISSLVSYVKTIKIIKQNIPKCTHQHNRQHDFHTSNKPKLYNNFQTQLEDNKYNNFDKSTNKYNFKNNKLINNLSINNCQKFKNNYLKNNIKLLKNKKIKIIKNTYKILKNSFSYRKNNFIGKNEIIVGAELNLNILDKNIIQKNIIDNYLKKYNSQPLDKYSAGSIFKRGQNFFPTKIIDELGLKGTRIGGAEISQKHAGFIVNLGNATSNDVLALIRLAKQKAKDVYGYVFEEEIEYIPQK